MKRAFGIRTTPQLGAFLLLVFLVQILTHASAAKSTRFALLIGNSDYPSAVGGKLTNPTNDIALVKGALLSDGFAEGDIVIVPNASRIQILEHFDEFAKRVGQGGPGAISFFYYSGHGAANDQRDNYLIPVDVPELRTTDFWYHAVPLRDLIDALEREAPNANHFVIFDACRNSLVLKDPGRKTIVQSKGFAPVWAPGGILVAFATGEGELASDEGNGAGPYARALADEIVKPGVEAVTVFRKVQLDLIHSIGQAPWMLGSPPDEVYFAGQTASASAEPKRAPQRVSISVSPDECRRNSNFRVAIFAVQDRDAASLVDGLNAACFNTRTGAYPYKVHVDPSNKGTTYIIPSIKLAKPKSDEIEDSVVSIAKMTLPPELSRMHPNNDNNTPGIFRGGQGPILGDVTVYLF